MSSISGIVNGVKFRLELSVEDVNLEHLSTILKAVIMQEVQSFPAPSAGSPPSDGRVEGVSVPTRPDGKSMTPSQFTGEMGRISREGDIEDGHSHADKLMCEILESLGYGDGVAIFRKMDKWYA